MIFRGICLRERKRKREREWKERVVRLCSVSMFFVFYGLIKKSPHILICRHGGIGTKVSDSKVDEYYFTVLRFI